MSRCVCESSIEYDQVDRVSCMSEDAVHTFTSNKDLQRVK